jgi:hypothetical protein
MEIIRAIWRNVVDLLVLNLILVPFMVLAPVGLVVLPLVLIAKNSNDDFSGLAQLFLWTAPLSCAFWTLVYSQWSGAMAWQRMGRVKTWRRDRGGFLHTATQATAWMFFGLFGSYLSEIAFLIAFHFVPWSVSGAPRLTLWFGTFPFACYAPLFTTWAWRRRYV